MGELEWETLKNYHRAREKEGETISETNIVLILFNGRYSRLYCKISLSVFIFLNQQSCMLTQMFCSKSITNELHLALLVLCVGWRFIHTKTLIHSGNFSTTLIILYNLKSFA